MAHLPPKNQNHEMLTFRQSNLYYEPNRPWPELSDSTAGRPSDGPPPAPEPKPLNINVSPIKLVLRIVHGPNSQIRRPAGPQMAHLPPENQNHEMLTLLQLNLYYEPSMARTLRFDGRPALRWPTSRPRAKTIKYQRFAN
jgi:hypothetical protein